MLATENVLYLLRYAWCKAGVGDAHVVQCSRVALLIDNVNLIVRNRRRQIRDADASKSEAIYRKFTE